MGHEASDLINKHQQKWAATARKTRSFFDSFQVDMHSSLQMKPVRANIGYFIKKIHPLFETAVTQFFAIKILHDILLESKVRTGSFIASGPCIYRAFV